MRRPLVIGNWKMNGTRLSIRDLVEAICSGLKKENQTEVGVCVPFVFIPEVANQLADTKLILGSQNVADSEKGAFTGEIAATMLVEYGCHFAIVGHSERRLLYKEPSEMVAARFRQAVSNNLQPILCIGETLEQRDNGDTFEVIDEQLLTVIEILGIEVFTNAVIAYEPVWAIGTGRTATTQQAQDVHAYIRGKIANFDRNIAQNIRILYGGSVKPENAHALFSMTDIDGGLIGGASLDANSFLSIINSSNTV